MAEFSGVRDLAAVLTGGNAIEQAAYSSAQERLIRERGARALMERRISQAAQEKIQADSLQSLINTMPAGRDRDILVAKLGSSFSGLQTGLGKEQQNMARSAALEALINGGDPDLINQLTGIASNKMTTPNNVLVQRQAVAQATRDEAAAALTQGKTSQLLPAQVSAQEALTGQRNAAAEYSQARSAAVGGPESQGLKPSGLDKSILDALFVTEEVPNPDYDPDAFMFKGDPTVQRETDLLQEFLVYQAEKSATDQRFLNAYFALSQFMLARSKGRTAPTPSAAPQKPSRRLLYDPASGGFIEQ